MISLYVTCAPICNSRENKLLLLLYNLDRLLTHWGRVAHICVSKLTIIGSDNGLSPDRRQTIIWTSAGLLLIGPLGTNFSEILIKILTFSFKKMRLKVFSAKRQPFCLSLNVLIAMEGCWEPASLDGFGAPDSLNSRSRITTGCSGLDENALRHSSGWGISLKK